MEHRESFLSLLLHDRTTWALMLSLLVTVVGIAIAGHQGMQHLLIELTPNAANDYINTNLGAIIALVGQVIVACVVLGRGDEIAAAVEPEMPRRRVLDPNQIRIDSDYDAADAAPKIKPVEEKPETEEPVQE